MPAIKKKWIKASHKDDKEEQTVPETGDEPGDEDSELNEESTEVVAVSPSKTKSAKKHAQSNKGQGNMLKGLDGEVLMEKRKRFVPTGEVKLNEWLEKNLEERTEETLPLTQLYQYYTDLCQGEGWDLLDVPEFNKVIKGKYGKAFGLSQDSALKGLLKERKLNKEKKKPLLGIRMKDVIHEAIEHFGNPAQGVRFFNLKMYIGTKYPALQLDIKPKILKRALEFGVGYGQLDLVKGIGMAGFYKLPGGEAPKEKTEKLEENTENDENKKGSQDDTDENAEEDGEKKKDASAEDKENKEESTDEKKKQQKPKKPQKPVKYSQLSHNNPDKIEDVFPLAITYQSAPKVVGLPKIRKYIAGKYREEVTDNRWRQVISKGVENGLWEHTSGSGISGSVHLLMDDFNPGSNQIEDQVCAAIIACHEPKSASALQIKKYVSRYHPEFKIDEKPEKFKKALLRAVSKSMIKQVSGLGANGSFQLTLPFVPSPSILAGDDESDDDEDDDSDDPDREYVSKGTKSRGVVKAKPVTTVASSRTGKAGKKDGRGRPSKRKTYHESSDEDSDAVPSKKKKKGSISKKSPAKPKKNKRDPSPLTDEDEEDVVEYTPRKSKSRGGGTPSARGKIESQSSQKANKASAGKSKVQSAAKETPQKGESKSPTKTKSPRKKLKLEDSDADDEEDVLLEYTPRKSKSRRGEDSDADDEEDVMPEYTPRKSKSRGGDVSSAQTPQTGSARGKKKSKK